MHGSVQICQLTLCTANANDHIVTEGTFMTKPASSRIKVAGCARCIDILECRRDG